MATSSLENDLFIKIAGKNEFVRDIRILKGRVSRQNVLKEALRPAAKYVKKMMKSEAPVGPTGNLKKSIQIKTLRGDPPATIVRSNFKVGRHTFLVTQGTRERYRGNSFKNLQRFGTFTPASGFTGKMTPNDFIGRTIKRTSTEARRMVIEGLERLIRR